MGLSNVTVKHIADWLWLFKASLQSEAGMPLKYFAIFANLNFPILRPFLTLLKVASTMENKGINPLYLMSSTVNWWHPQIP